MPIYTLVIAALLLPIAAYCSVDSPKAPINSQAVDRKVLDRIAAVVNNRIILESDVERRLSSAIDLGRREGRAVAERGTLRRQVLERLVSEQALLDRASLVGIVVEEEILQRAVERIAEQNGISVTGLRNQL
jgi:peptidyl-prolyl cis-trans isomerase SurA